MPRGIKNTSEFSITQLERMLVSQLSGRRKALAEELARVEAQLAAFGESSVGGGMAFSRAVPQVSMGGGNGARPAAAPSVAKPPRKRHATRVKNERSLIDTIGDVLGAAGGPVGVGDIVSGVLATGYRTNSDNFRNIVNQQLIKEKKFQNAGRGLYQLRG
jgi:hypothetical protein